MKWLINLIFQIWSFSPVFALTCDATFMNYTIGEKRKPRLSLLNLNFGEYVVFIFTYDFEEKKFNLLCVKSLSKYPQYNITNNKITQLEKDYKIHIESLGKDELLCEKESLQNHISLENSRIETSNQKINIYTTIILTVIPLLIALIQWETLFYESKVSMVATIFLLYSIMNICCYVFCTVRVNGIERSSFSDLKNSEQKEREIMWHYYFDWQHLKKKADLFVSYVIRIQEWAVAALIVFVIVVVADSIHVDSCITEYNENQVYTIDLNEFESVYSESSISYVEVLVNLRNNTYGEIIVISNGADLHQLQKEFEKYEKHKIYYLTDSKMEKNIIKIILEE